jgi:uncharacterized protein YjbI with pentapeptide repeats
MSMRRVKVHDEHGEYICTVSVPEESQDFERGNLEGLNAPSIKSLRGKNFSGALMYWAFLADADLSDCNFDGADLRGANLRGALLHRCSFRKADLGRDNLNGATDLQAADLAGAILNRAKLDGALYDSRTIFPKGFLPNDHGMVEVPDE